jgi:hypothetical protein
MSNQIDFRTLPANVPVLCIPRVYPNINEGRIRRIFDDLNMGELERIDMVSKTSVKPGANPLEKEEKFNRVFVHFKRWNNSENSNLARERLLNGKEIKIIYDEPWFWKVSAYREPATRRESAPQKHPSEDRRSAFKPTLAFDSDEDKCSKPTSSNYYDNRDERRRDSRPSQRQYTTSRRDDSRERPHRRDDSRERSRPESSYAQRRDDRPRKRYDSRERSRNEANYAQRRDDRQRQREPSTRQEMPERKFIETNVVLNETNTPPCSPPKQIPELTQTQIDYGNIIIPKRNRTYGGKKSETTSSVIEKEDGEVSQVEKKEE